MQPSAVHIGRLHNHYLVPHEHGTPEEVRNLCESAIAATLSDSLAAALTHALPDEDGSVCFIRRLEIEFAINTEANFSSFPKIWATEIAKGVSDALQQDGPDVLHFPDRASYLAHFFLDLVEGSAWNKWYYASMRGLRMLPVSAALRTCICEAPEIGLKALRSLKDPGLVLKEIDAAGAARVLTAFELSTISGDANACWHAINGLWQTVLGVPAEEEERRALLLFLGATRDNITLANKALGDAARAVCRLARRLQKDDSADGRDLLGALRGKGRDFYRVARQEDSAILSPLLHCEGACLDQLLRRVGNNSTTNPETKQEARFTAFGGAFLLFPLLDELPLQQATAGWPDLGNVSAVSLVRLLTIIKCFGVSRALGCFGDPLIRDLLRIPPQITAHMVRRWLAALSRDHLSAFSRAIARSHLETAAAEGRAYSLVSLLHKGRSLALVLDGARGLWLCAEELGNDQDKLIVALRDLPSPEKVICPDSLGFVVENSFPDSEIEAANVSPATSPGLDLEYLALPSQFGDCNAELTLSLVAQGILRLFACKLPGFGTSSLSHLFSNFLDCCAAVEESAKKRIVYLSRAPLHLVLRIAGLNRRNYELSWLDGKPCAIFPEG